MRQLSHLRKLFSALVSTEVTKGAGEAVCVESPWQHCLLLGAWGHQERVSSFRSATNDLNSIQKLLQLPLGRGARLMCALLPAVPAAHLCQTSSSPELLNSSAIEQNSWKFFSVDCWSLIAVASVYCERFSHRLPGLYVLYNVHVWGRVVPSTHFTLTKR